MSRSCSEKGIRGCRIGLRVAVAVFGTAVNGSVLAQGTGKIVGTVTDSTGGVLASAPLAGVKPEFHQNQFGGSFGGPIKKDQTFFFVDYDGFRRIPGKTQRAAVPTACELGRATCNGIAQLANFADSLTLIYNPQTHSPFPNNLVPLNSISTISDNYAALYSELLPAACQGINCNFISSFNATQFAPDGDVRQDHHFSGKNSFYALYSINNTNTVTPDALPVVSVAGLTVHPERAELQCRFSKYRISAAFNVTNTRSFGLPRTNIVSWVGTGAAAVPAAAGNFGKITNMNAFHTPRDIQLALKLF